MIYAVKSNTELYHHGILGMKWGKRNGPPYPLGSGDHSASERKAGWRKSLGAESKSSNYYKKKANKTSYVERKSKEYQKQGLSKAEADAAAARKKKIMTGVAIGAGAAALTVAGIMVYKKYGLNYIDKTIKAGQTIQNLHADPNRLKNGSAFYAAIQKGDAKKYIAKWGQSRENRSVKNKIVAEAARNIKVASRKNSEKIYQSLMANNQEFKDSVNKIYSEFGGTDMVDLALRKESKNAYDRFNRAMPVIDGNGVPTDIKEARDKAMKLFNTELSKAGYGGYLDVNDRSYSGFNTNAIIFLNNVGDFTEKSVSKLTNLEIMNAKQYVQNMEILEANAGRLAIMGALVGIKAGKKASDAYDNSVVKKKKSASRK